MKWLINEWKKCNFLVKPTCYPIDKQLLSVRKLLAFGKKNWVRQYMNKQTPHHTNNNPSTTRPRLMTRKVFSFFFPKLLIPIYPISHFTHLSLQNLTSVLLWSTQNRGKRSYGVQFLGLKGSPHRATFCCSSCYASFWYFFSTFLVIFSSGFFDFASISLSIWSSCLEFAREVKI